MIVVMLLEACTALAITAWLLADPGVCHPRRWVGMVTDYGTLATLMACLVTYKLRNVRIKGLAIPASLPPVVFNMIIVGAFEITFFFSDGAPTAAKRSATRSALSEICSTNATLCLSAAQ